MAISMRWPRPRRSRWSKADAGAWARVGRVGIPDLDHVGAERAHWMCNKRLRQHMRDVDHPDALERSRHRALLAGAVASQARRELRQNWASRRSRLPRSSIFRPPNKLVGRSFG